MRDSSEEGSRVLICHYRVGWTDGVSLEIEKRREILEEMGYRVSLLAGPGSKGADYLIPELDFDSREARMISANAFGGMKDFDGEQALADAIHRLSDRIEEGLDAILGDWRPQFILLHNIFSHGRHIAAARAFCRSLERYGCPVLATHHDFYWERRDFQEASGPWVRDFLTRYVPPKIPGLRHAVINSLAARSLLKRTGIDPLIFPDTLDFSMRAWEKDDYNRRLLEDFQLSEKDIFILQATRIVPRKGIELIPPLIHRLNSPDYLDRLRGRRLYNGKLLGKDTRFVFLLAGYPELEAEPYRRALEKMMNNLAVPYRFLRSRIAAEREEQGKERIYSLFDTYPYADLVSYPSIFEGWGNQFIEAVFACRPVMVYEYPVFKSDIMPKGYQVISLGDAAVCPQGPSSAEPCLHSLSDEVIEGVCHEVVEWLLSPETNAKLADNYRLARKNNSYDYLRALMRRSMEHCGD